jgi:hypothetical protein
MLGANTAPGAFEERDRPTGHESIHHQWTSVAASRCSAALAAKEAVVNDYSTFKVRIDDPTASPSHEYVRSASGLPDMVLRRKPQFSIGIVGDWGSAKRQCRRSKSV